jgi:hypothetical protein
VLAGDGEVIDVRWSGVVQVVAFKLDEFTVDTVVLDIEAEGLGWVRVTDDDEGFWALATAIGSELPGVVDGWIAGVLQPPFAANHTVVYERNPR